MGSDGNLAGDVTADGQSRDLTAKLWLNPGTRTKHPRQKRRKKKNIRFLAGRIANRFCFRCVFVHRTRYAF